MSEDDIDALTTDATGAPRVDRDRRAPRFSWTPAYEATFFRSLCESVQLGLRENSSFKSEAWERAAAALQVTHGAFPAKSHLINKSDNARKRFRLWRGLREDPEFLYNPVAKTVTATEEAWRQHIEREPLSRALRGRPFDHEEYMEILYPDVVGSGGAPKRIMKPRRRTDGAVADDSDMPGTGVINLHGGAPQANMTSPDQQQQQQRPLLSQTPTGSSSGSMVTPHLEGAPVSSVIPSQTVSTTNSSALTPPDEILPQANQNQNSNQTQARKRRQNGASTGADAVISPPLTSAAPGASSSASSPQKRRRTSRNGSVTTSAPVVASSSNAAHTSGSNMQIGFVEDLLDAMKSRAAPRWREQALDIFFRDFAAEEYDLQVKISENVLSNEHKALVFCKMPDRVRQHWVSKFREMHQLNNKST